MANPYQLNPTPMPVEPPDFGQSLQPAEGAESGDLKTGWKNFFAEAAKNPQILSFAFNALSAAADPNFTGGVAGAVGQGLQGVSAYNTALTALQDRERKEQRLNRREAREEERLDLAREQLGADIEANKANIKAKEMELRVREMELIQLQNKYTPGTPEYQMVQLELDKTRSDIEGNRAQAQAALSNAGSARMNAETARMESGATIEAQRALAEERKQKGEYWKRGGKGGAAGTKPLDIEKQAEEEFQNEIGTFPKDLQSGAIQYPENYDPQRRRAEIRARLRRDTGVDAPPTVDEENAAAAQMLSQADGPMRAKMEQVIIDKYGIARLEAIKKRLGQ